MFTQPIPPEKRNRKERRKEAKRKKEKMVYGVNVPLVNHKKRDNKSNEILNNPKNLNEHERQVLDTLLRK